MLLWTGVWSNATSLDLSSVKELTVTLLLMLVPCTSCSTWDLHMYDSLNTFGFNNTCGYPTYISYNKYQPIIFCEPSSCVSPWYNRTSWLGVKHQHTYLPLVCQGSRFFPLFIVFLLKYCYGTDLRVWFLLKVKTAHLSLNFMANFINCIKLYTVLWLILTLVTVTQRKALFLH